MSVYTEQAESFINRHGITFSSEFVAHDLFFDDDTDTRDIYYLRLRRKNRVLSVKFGQSVAHSRQPNIERPTAYDMLTCITKNDPGDFENFCAEYGYDTDSRKAEKTWRAVAREWKKVRGFFSDSELEELQEIQ